MFFSLSEMGVNEVNGGNLSGGRGQVAPLAPPCMHPPNTLVDEDLCYRVVENPVI